MGLLMVVEDAASSVRLASLPACSLHRREMLLFCAPARPVLLRTTHLEHRSTGNTAPDLAHPWLLILQEILPSLGSRHC
jgi:hypothetical protein